MIRTKNMFLKLAILLVFVSTSWAAASMPIVEIANGVLQGTWRDSTKGRSYASFQGIPYARPPIGEYRFASPRPMKSWSGVWNATKFLSPCLQYDPFSKQILGREDCLFLNVFTPDKNFSARYPVMIFIHGGAFMYGTANLYDPSHLMDRDLVVVTLNYRLGPLGFLGTNDDTVAGNAGLKDQALALHWVKDNIDKFGGDPHSITLTGESAGGSSVHHHFLSPLSKGTFTRGVALSGSAFAPWSFTLKPFEKAKILASIVGCPSTTSQIMADCLRNRPGEVIVDAQYQMFVWKVHLFTPFVPTIEAAMTKNPFLVQHPYRATISSAMEKLPLMTSVTSNEGLYPAASYLSDPKLLPEIETRWEDLASELFQFNDTLPTEAHPGVASKIKEHYFGGRAVDRNTFQQLVQALGDRHFGVGLGKLAQIHALKSNQSVYVYRYAFRGERSLSNLMAQDNENYGTCHGDDVLHIFKSSDLESQAPDDVKMREKLIDMIYNFCLSGVPKVSEDISWLPVTPGAPGVNYLEILSPTSFEMKNSVDFGQRTFWDSLGFNEDENYHP